jgi:hydroxymethylbilane synthase
VERLGLKLGDLLAYEISPDSWLPAPGQGVVAIEARADDNRVLDHLSRIDDIEAHQAAKLERQLLANFEGGCHTAFGAWAVPSDENWRLLVGLEDGGFWRQTEAKGSWENLAQLGPASGMDFQVPQLLEQEELCRPLRL